MAALSRVDIETSEPQASMAELIPFPATGSRSARAKLEDMASMCVGYLSLLGFVSGMALLIVR
ncbi:hypothetical protein [Rhizorhapis suberifaciens]|uniref:Uncharacterized protein n=1 Tax=Rhizorhapis suberifaciens TaxID=13656 RepID=A0A840HUL8_9SPHN|nr:hypothetical protein [Rhizorhapis suberifaciens]MBB4641280.1 hypothetical protein [Rhizorhapis suberifaciens]